MILTRLARPALVAIVFGVIASACSQAPVSATQIKSTKVSRSQSKANLSQPPVVETIGRLLMQAQDAAADGNFDEAHALIARANAFADKTPLEKYKIAEISANVAVREKDPLATEIAYEEIVNSSAAEPETYSDYLKKLTLLSFNNRHYDKTVLYGNLWLEKNGYFNPSIGEVVANAYFNNRDYVNAESMIDRGLKSYANGKGSVKLNWLQVKIACATMLRGKDSADALRKQLIDTYPQFRKQLALRP
jgi:hypothetical protein